MNDSEYIVYIISFSFIACFWLFFSNICLFLLVSHSIICLFLLSSFVCFSLFFRCLAAFLLPIGAPPFFPDSLLFDEISDLLSSRFNTDSDQKNSSSETNKFNPKTTSSTIVLVVCRLNAIVSIWLFGSFPPCCVVDDVVSVQ